MTTGRCQVRGCANPLPFAGALVCKGCYGQTRGRIRAVMRDLVDSVPVYGPPQRRSDGTLVYPSGPHPHADGEPDVRLRRRQHSRGQMS